MIEAPAHVSMGRRHRSVRAMPANLTTSKVVTWVSPAIAAVYFVLFLFRLPRLIERLYWDSDGAVAMVVAETAGQGDTILGHYGWFTTLCLTQLTRWIPFHRELWEYSPYFFYLFSMALLTWVAFRIAGKWAALSTASLAIATSPMMSYVSVSLNFHSSAWFGTAIMAAALWWMVAQDDHRRVVLAAIPLALFAGTTFASDHLFGFVGLVPFGLAGAVMISYPQHKRAGWTIVATSAFALPVAIVATTLMQHLGFTVWQAPAKFSALDQLWSNTKRLLHLLYQLGNGVVPSDVHGGVRQLLAHFCAGLVFVALITPFVLLRRSLKDFTKSPQTVAYAVFWVVSVAINCVAYVASTNGYQVGYYMSSTFYALIVAAPLVMSTSVARRNVASVGVAIFALTSLFNLADAKTGLNGGKPSIAYVANDVVNLAAQHNAMRGYADYWEASSLTWSTKSKVDVQAVVLCQKPAGIQLCPFGVNVNTSWYAPTQGNSFLLTDRYSMSVQGSPPDLLGNAIETRDLGKGFTMYVYPYDIGTKIDFGGLSWRPTT